MNTSLGGHADIAWTAFYGSLALFLAWRGGAQLSAAANSAAPGGFRASGGLYERGACMADTRHQRGVARAFVCRVVHVVGHRGEAQRRRLRFNKEPALLAYGRACDPRSRRIPYGLIVSLYGSRRSYAAVTLILPALGTGFAVQDPKTPYWVLLFLVCRDRNSRGELQASMATVTLWFPKQLLRARPSASTVWGIPGVTIAQFTIPLVIGFSLLGASEASPGAPVRPIHLENAAFVWIPIILDLFRRDLVRNQGLSG